ncbi:MAG: hypothetical protein OXN81_16275, partial [Alphaproteobacteria bacterium]|nr:hypothetical protein [Alphaproteobacteria bacterium]
AAFAAGDPPVGVSAAMHAAALAWVPPGFAAFDTGRTVGDAGDATSEAAGTAPPSKPETTEPVVDARTDPAEAAPVGNGHATEADPASSDGAAANAVNGDADTADPGAEADRGDAGEVDPDPAVAGGPDGIAATGPVPPVPANGHDANPDPMEIPEFLRRVQ